MSSELTNVFAAKMLPQQELFSPGHRACQGCAPALAMRYMLKALGPDTIVCNSTGCMEIISSSYPETAWGVPCWTIRPRSMIITLSATAKASCWSWVT